MRASFTFLCTILVALVALAAPARADGPPHPRTAEAERPPPPPARRAADQPLSEEDAALVRELALLERVELLKNLELFEPAAKAPPQRKKN